MKLDNRHIAIFFVVSIIMMTAIIPSFADKKQPSLRSNNTANDTLSYDDEQRYNTFFLEAVRQKEAGNDDAAFDLFNHCLDINPNAAESYYMLAMYYSQLGNDSTAFKYLEKAASLSPSNGTYQERVAMFNIFNKDYDGAIAAYEKLYEANRERSDVLNILVKLYEQKKDYDGMLRTISRLEQQEGSSEDIVFAKMQVFELKGDKNAAYASLKSLSDKHPNDVNYKVMMGNWLLQNDKKKQAYKIFTNALKEDPDNSYVQTSLYDYYNSQGQDSLARELCMNILTSKHTESKTKLTMLTQLIKDYRARGIDSTKVLSILKTATTANPKDGDLAALEATYMMLIDMPEDTVNAVLTHVVDIAPENTGARLQLIQSLWKRQKWDEIIELSKAGSKYNPEDMVYYYFLGLSYYQKDDEDKTLDALRRGVSVIQSTSNPDIVSDFYALMGDILYKKKQIDNAYAAYDSCLQWKDDNISCLNNYAYYLSVEGRDLQKAEQMSYKTIKAEPKNSTYLDTYAWILFLEKRYAEAKIYIDQAILNDTDSVKSAVVIGHAGDIYSFNGDADKALDFWRQALAIDGNDAVLQKKVKLRKYVKD